MTMWPASADVARGQALLQKQCGSCHAIGRTGESPRADTPPFRQLARRYPVESLEEALGEGLLTGHPDMPEFSFDADEVGDIIAYLKSIQQR
jgi:mono/diheme cytochrome c family protein